MSVLIFITTSVNSVSSVSRLLFNGIIIISTVPPFLYETDNKYSWKFLIFPVLSYIIINDKDMWSGLVDIFHRYLTIFLLIAVSEILFSLITIYISGYKIGIEDLRSKQQL